MVEPISMAVGTALGVVGLYGACLEIMDIIDTGKDFGRDSQMLLTLFEAEKLLFTKWGTRVGIGGGRGPSLHRCLDGRSSHYQVVYGILRQLHILLSDTETLKNKYGLELGSSSIATRPAEEGPTYKERRTTFARRLVWGGRDKKKFELLLNDVGTFVKKLHDLVTFEDPKVGDIAKELSMVKSFLEGESTESREFRSDMEVMRGDIKDFIDENRRITLLAWIGGVSTDQQYEEATRERQAGTCTWIHSHGTFLDLFGPPYDKPSVLWLHGGPGIGKTFLSASIVQYLKCNSSRPTAFFFCTHEDTMKNQVKSIIQSWVYQLAAQREPVLEVIRRSKPNVGDATQTLMWKVFKAILVELGSCYLVIDGYDECLDYDPASRARQEGTRKLFLANLMLSIQSTGAKVVIMSRHLGEIKSGLGLDNPTSQLAFVSDYPITKSDTAEDIKIVARAITDSKISSTHNRSEISDKLAKDCQGMFLWLRLEGQRLRKGMRPDRVKEILASTPRGLGHAYKRDLLNISKMEEYDCKKAQDILRWMLYAFRPLSVIELLQLTEVSIDSPVQLDEYGDIDEEVVEARILSRCGSFIEIRKNSWRHNTDTDIGDSTVHFVHFSAKEFLLSAQKDSIEHSLPASFYPDPGRDHGILHDACLTYTFLRPLVKPAYPPMATVLQGRLPISGLPAASEWASGTLGRVPIFIAKYPYDYWVKHFYLSTGKRRFECVGIQKRLLDQGPLFTRWFHNVLEGGSFPISFRDDLVHCEDNMTPLHAASYLGLLELCKELLGNMDEVPRDILNFAILGGRQNIVSMLLSRDDTDVNAANGSLHLTPLVVASRCSQEEITQPLLSLEGIDVNKQSPLTFACEVGCISIVRMFLARKDIDANSKDIHGYTPLYIAISNSNREVTKLLLSRRDIDANAVRIGETLLHMSVIRGWQDITNLLLTRPEVDVNAVNNKGETPLHKAVVSGWQEVTDLLLSRPEVDVNAVNNKGETPLHMSVVRGWQDITNLLLTRPGVDVNAVNNNGETPLHEAVVSGWQEVTDLLLSRPEVDVNAVNNNGETPLHTAVLFAGQGRMNALLSNAFNNNGEAPLHMGVISGWQENMDVLLSKREVDVNAVNHHGETPLHLASYIGCVDAVELLLARDFVKVNVMNKINMTPLDNTTAQLPWQGWQSGGFWDSETGRTRIAELLRQKNGQTGDEIRQLARTPNLPNLCSLQSNDRIPPQIDSVGAESAHNIPSLAAVTTQNSTSDCGASPLPRPAYLPAREIPVSKEAQHSMETEPPYSSSRNPSRASIPTIESPTDETISSSGPVLSRTSSAASSSQEGRTPGRKRRFSRVG